MNHKSAFVSAEKSPTGFASNPPTSVESGLIAGTMLETAIGWQSIEDLIVGQRVHTFDGGLKPICALTSLQIVTTELILIPGGVLSAIEDLLLLPDQSILIDGDLAEQITGLPLALVPARALVNYAQVERVIDATPRQVFCPAFAEVEVVWANSGVLLECSGHMPDHTSYMQHLRYKDATILRLAA
jgi:hypothetical protein